MIILGIDPGYAIVGWGVIRYERGRFIPVDFGAITTRQVCPLIGGWRFYTMNSPPC